MAHAAKKHNEIKSWLEFLFGKESIPKYEVNDYTISVLYSLYLHNKEVNRLTTLAIEDFEQKTEEYKVEEERIQDVLDVFGLPIDSLSNPGKQSIKVLAELATILNLKDTSKTNYLLAISALLQECKETDNEINKLDKDVDSLIKQFSEINKSIAAINKYFSSIYEFSYTDGLMTEKRRNETLQLKAKAEKYSQQIEEFKVANKFVDSRFHHETLIQLAKDLEGLKKELQPLELKLKTYKCLPPDLNLAKVKIEEAKRELEKLECELQVDIDLIAF